MARIGWAPGRRFGNEEIRSIPRSLLEELRVFPLPTKESKLKILCFWDVDDEERTRAVSEALGEYIPGRFDVVFVRPMGGRWSTDPDGVLRELLDKAHASGDLR